MMMTMMSVGSRKSPAAKNCLAVYTLFLFLCVYFSFFFLVFWHFVSVLQRVVGVVGLASRCNALLYSVCRLLGAFVWSILACRISSQFSSLTRVHIHTHMQISIVVLVVYLHMCVCVCGSDILAFRGAHSPPIAFRIIYICMSVCMYVLVSAQMLRHQSDAAIRCDILIVYLLRFTTVYCCYWLSTASSAAFLFVHASDFGCLLFTFISNHLICLRRFKFKYVYMRDSGFVCILLFNLNLW